jgi:hypothetical protein
MRFDGGFKPPSQVKDRVLSHPVRITTKYGRLPFFGKYLWPATLTGKLDWLRVSKTRKLVGHIQPRSIRLILHLTRSCFQKFLEELRTRPKPTKKRGQRSRAKNARRRKASYKREISAKKKLAKKLREGDTLEPRDYLGVGGKSTKRPAFGKQADVVSGYRPSQEKILINPKYGVMGNPSIGPKSELLRRVYGPSTRVGHSDEAAKEPVLRSQGEPSGSGTSVAVLVPESPVAASKVAEPISVAKRAPNKVNLRKLQNQMFNLTSKSPVPLTPKDSLRFVDSSTNRVRHMTNEDWNSPNTQRVLGSGLAPAELGSLQTRQSALTVMPDWDKVKLIYQRVNRLGLIVEVPASKPDAVKYREYLKKIFDYLPQSEVPWVKPSDN